MVVRISLRRLALGLGLALSLAGPVVGQELRGAGATFPANLYFAWIAQFAEVEPGIDVRYESVGSGEGIRLFLAGEVDFGATDRPLTDAEIAAAPNGALHIPATAGMVSVSYNLPGIESELRLTRTALAGIFAGEIRQWDDPLIASVNPGLDLPSRNIAVVGRLDSSGTTYAFSSHLDSISDIWRISGRGVSMLVDWPGGAMQAPGNEGVAARILLTEYSIGYVEYSFARALEMPVAAIENRSGAFVAPSNEAGLLALAAAAAAMPEDGRQVVLDAEAPGAYPIVTFSWLLTDESMADAAKAAALRRFIGWGLDDGQDLAEGIGYLPLPAEVRERATAILAQLR